MILKVCLKENMDVLMEQIFQIKKRHRESMPSSVKQPVGKEVGSNKGYPALNEERFGTGEKI